MSRGLEITLSVLILCASAPIFLVCALLVRVTSPGPALFRQDRVGLDRNSFEILKFRTMYVDSDDHLSRELNEAEIRGELEAGPRSDGSFRPEHDPRITPVGKFLRRFSLDELPQLLNVIKGDMALVGPRPSLPWEVELFPASAAPRFNVRPGLTGLWQVSGRTKISAPEMLELDVAYVEKRSTLYDLWILLRTLPAVAKAVGSG